MPVKSKDNSNDHPDRTRALLASICDSVVGTGAGCEGSRPTARSFLPVHLPEGESLWLHHRAGGCVPSRTPTRAAAPPASAGLRPACALVSEAYRPAREGALHLQAAVGRKPRSVMDVSASWLSWSEGFGVRGTDSGFSSDRSVHGFGGRRCDEPNGKPASGQHSQAGRYPQPRPRNSKNLCKIRDVAFALA